MFVFSRGYSATSLFGKEKVRSSLLLLSELAKHGEIEDIASGEAFSVFKFANGKFIYLGDKEYPFEVAEPIKEMNCGSGNFCLLAKSGNVYVGENASNIIQVELPEPVISVANPADEFYFLTTSGTVYTYNYRQRKLSKQETPLDSPTDSIVKLYGVNQFNSVFMRTKENQVYTFSTRYFNPNNTLLLHPKQKANLKGCCRMQFFIDNPLDQLYIGGVLGVAKLMDGRWIIFGKYLGMAVNSYYDVIKLKFPVTDLVQVVCNWYSTVFLTCDNKLFAIGMNEFCEIAPGEVKPTKEMVDISQYNTSVTDKYGKIARVVGAGGQIYFFVRPYNDWNNKIWSMINQKHQKPFTDVNFQ